MDEGRLKAVRKSQRLHRKFAHAINDTIRNRQEYYESCLSREEQEARTRLVSKVMNMRRTFVRSRVLLQCLNVYRQEDPPDRAVSEPLLGKYGGRPIDSFSRDIDQRLAWFHPRLRRLRKVDRVKQTCLRQGAILDEETVQERMKDFYARNLQSTSPSPRLSPDKPGKAGGKGLIDDDDDDDFDIKDYHDPIGASKIQLKLHPFGNMVELNNSVSAAQKRPVKRDLLNRRSNDRRVIKSVTETTSGVANISHSTLTSTANDEATKTRDSKTHAQSTSTSEVRLSSPSKEEQSPRFSKYSEPLPPIIQGPSAPQKASTNAALSSDTSTEHAKVKYPEKPSLAKDLQPKPSNNKLPTTALRLSHSKKQNGDLNNNLLSKENVINEDVENANEKNEANGERPKLTRRKTLILPPIETTKEMVKNK